ncbi:Alginate lyase [compost metagenome]
MATPIEDFIITLPAPKSATSSTALELPGDEALRLYPQFIQRLSGEEVRMTAPMLAASTQSTTRTRCEWRESRYWSLESAADHWSRQEMRLTQVNSGQKVVVAQMHVKDSDRPPLKVFWNKGKLTLGFRRSHEQEEPVNSTVLDKVPLGATFRLNLHVTDGGSVSVTASCNGVKSAPSPLRLDGSWNGRLLNFHGGVYNQLDPGPSTLAADASVCVISELSVTHS